jgi:hypothetical protein
MKHAIRYDGRKHQLESEIIAQLGRPGDGVPWWARLILKYVVKPRVVRKSTWQSNIQQIDLIHSKIMKEVGDLSLNDLTTRALIPPQRGLEDSSRYWSIAMTLRHLIIVGSGIKKIILHIGQNEKYNEIVDTATVKPENQVYDLNIIQDYQTMTESYISDLEQTFSSDLSQVLLSQTHYHPWFGAMNAKDWFWLVGTHMGLHLRQIREIKKAVQLSRLN